MKFGKTIRRAGLTVAVAAFAAASFAAQAKEIKIGVIYDYTGPLARIARLSSHGFTAAATVLPRVPCDRGHCFHK